MIKCQKAINKTVIYTDPETGEVLSTHESTINADTRKKAYRKLKFLTDFTKHEFESFQINNAYIEEFIDGIDKAPLFMKLLLYFQLHLEPGTNKIMHPNGKRITDKFIMERFKVKHSNVTESKKYLESIGAIRKHKGWYYFNPYITIKYFDNQHFYSRETLNLFKNDIKITA